MLSQKQERPGEVAASAEPVSSTFPEMEKKMTSHSDSTAAPDAATVTATGISMDDFIAQFESLAPMQRLFVRQQLYALETDEYCAFAPGREPKDVRADYEEWLSGFDQSIIDKFESGEWLV